MISTRNSLQNNTRKRNSTLNVTRRFSCALDHIAPIVPQCTGHSFNMQDERRDPAVLTSSIARNSKRMVTFLLPSPEENAWERTGFGFKALKAYKDFKKGRSKMKTIVVQVEKQVQVLVEEQVQVRDDEEIVNFLNSLVRHVETHTDKVECILSMDECPKKTSLRHDLLASPSERMTWKSLLRDFTTDFIENPSLNVSLSDWLTAAEQMGYFPLPESWEETDHGAIAQANMPPAEKDEQGDTYMDDAIM